MRDLGDFCLTQRARRAQRGKRIEEKHSSKLEVGTGKLEVIASGKRESLCDFYVFSFASFAAFA